MHRARASLPPDAIRIEDEVWQEAFRETTRPRSRPRLRSHDGGHAPAMPVRGRPASSPVGARRVSGPASRPASVRTETVRAEPSGSAATGDEAPVRRTVTITGRGAERNLPWPSDAGRRRPARLPHERAGFKPDRVAMWAVFLGLLLVLVAAASAHT